MYTSESMKSLRPYDASRVYNQMTKTKDYTAFETCTFYPSGIKSIVAVQEGKVDGGHAVAFFPAWAKTTDIDKLAAYLTVQWHLG